MYVQYIDIDILICLLLLLNVDRATQPVKFDNVMSRIPENATDSPNDKKKQAALKRKSLQKTPKPQFSTLMSWNVLGGISDQIISEVDGGQQSPHPGGITPLNRSRVGSPIDTGNTHSRKSSPLIFNISPWDFERKLDNKKRGSILASNNNGNNKRQSIIYAKSPGMVAQTTRGLFSPIMGHQHDVIGIINDNNMQYCSDYNPNMLTDVASAHSLRFNEDEMNFITNDEDNELKLNTEHSALKAINSVRIIENTLPALNDWLQKLRLNIRPKIYQKRWVFIRDGNLIWHNKKVLYDNNKKIGFKERNKYDGCISLLMIKEVKKYESKSDKSFKFLITCYKNSNKNKKDKKIVFKCDSEYKRDQWVQGLQQHCDSLNAMIDQF